MNIQYKLSAPRKMSDVSVKAREGFTLVEVILYVAILAILLLAVGASTQSFLEARVKNQVIAEVDSGGSTALNIILQTIRNATSITGPTATNSSNTLTLVVPDASKSPTVFTFASEKIQVQEGAGSVIDLTNSNKILISLQGGDSGIFSNFSRTTPVVTPDIIRVRFNVAHKQPAGVNVYYQSYTKDFQGAASLR